MTAKPKSFLLYASYGSMIARLSLEERGTLLTALFDYVNGWEVDEENMTVPVAIVFCTIRDGIDRDREAYEEKCAKNTANGRLGGRPKKDQKTDRFFDEPKKANNNNNNN
ncbi:MAG: hypothetical protein IJW16_05455, partial [Clostridia bacterium]|nr:hypothetical protein [Clostridia bacterium]